MLFANGGGMAAVLKSNLALDGSCSHILCGGRHRGLFFRLYLTIKAIWASYGSLRSGDGCLRARLKGIDFMPAAALPGLNTQIFA